MSDHQEETFKEVASAIRITRLNADKTRKDTGSDTVYHVYFELSEFPPSEWKEIFAREWNGLNLHVEARIDEAFLVLRCALHEVAPTLLPALKKVVAATNEEYNRFILKGAIAREHRQDARMQERKDVEDLAASVHFE